MSVQDINSDASRSSKPSCRWLLEDMMAVEVRMFSNVLVPFISENDVGSSLIGINKEYVHAESLMQHPTDDGNHRCDAGSTSNQSDVGRHALNPMPTSVWTAHHDSIADGLVVQIF